MRKLKKLIKTIIFLGFIFLVFNLYLIYRVPIKYEYFVDSVSKETGVDKAVILALIKTESRYNLYSLSPKGAFGLMQIMPKTAEYVKTKYEIPIEDAEQYFDPYFNIKIGTLYFSELYEKFGDLGLAVAAYNAGPTITKKWGQEGIVSKDDETYKNIPYMETRNYVERVLKSREDYAKLIKYKYRVPKFLSDMVLNFAHKSTDKINTLKKFTGYLDGVINAI